MRLRLPLAAVLIIGLSLASLAPASADSNFAKYDSNTNCDFWLARHNVVTGNDPYSATSAWGCDNTHSMYVLVQVDGVPSSYCETTANNRAECSISVDTTFIYHTHVDNTTGVSLVQEFSWSSTD